MTNTHTIPEFYYSSECTLMREHLSVQERVLYDRFLIEKRKIYFLHGRSLFKTWMARHFLDSHLLHYSLHASYQKKPTPYYRNRPLSDIDINLSHSGKYAIMGIGQHTPVGVDLEMLRPAERIPLLLRFLCSDSELMEYSGIPMDELLVTKIWVIKEAVLKAQGLGFSEDPHSIHINWVKEEAYHCDQVFFWRIFPLENYYCCIASQTDLSQVRLTRLP